MSEPPSPKPSSSTPAATPATINNHPTGLAGWRRAIGYPATENPSAHSPGTPGRPHTMRPKSPLPRRSTAPTATSASTRETRAAPATRATLPCLLAGRVPSRSPVIWSLISQPQRDVGGLHRFLRYPDQLIAQGAQVRLLAQPCREDL